MPRGVYDRTKTPEQRAAEKTKPGKKAAKAGAPKRKYTRRAAVETSATKPSPSQNGPDLTFFLMGEVRNNLATLMQVSERFGDLPSVKAEVEAHVGIIGQLREKLLSVDDDVEIEMSDDEVQGAPNGVTAPVHQAAVPLPPPPSVAPVMPTH